MAYDLLVTGACGFLGSQVVRAALAQGLNVLATDMAQASRVRLREGVDFQDLDICGPEDRIRSALGSVGAVVHCAAYGVDYRQNDLEAALRVNVLASVRLQAAAAGARFVHVGTAYEYGPAEGVQAENFCPAPRGIYGVSKLAGSMAVLDRAAANGGQAAVVRPFGMYGPWEGEHKLVPLVMRSMLKGDVVELTPGEQIRDYVYVGDVATACVRAVMASVFPSGCIINLGSGSETTLRALVEAAAQAVDGDLSLLRWGAKPYRPDEIMRTQGTCARARDLLGWVPETSLASGMAITAAAERERLRTAG